MNRPEYKVAKPLNCVCSPVAVSWLGRHQFLFYQLVFIKVITFQQFSNSDPELLVTQAVDERITDGVQTQRYEVGVLLQTSQETAMANALTPVIIVRIFKQVGNN